MEWYGPLTVLPAIGLLIMSTSNFIVSLNSEIIELEKADNIKEEIIMLKLAQLKRLGFANASFYAASLLFLLAGLTSAFMTTVKWFELFMLTGVVATTVGLTFLFIHSIKSVKIRHQNLKLDN